MDTRTLEQAFNAVFHKKESFADFCSLDFATQITEIAIKDRSIYKTSDKLKKYLRFIDKVILRHLSKNTQVVHSYIKGKSVLTAVKSHAPNKAFFLTDIQSFFPNIGREDVRRLLTRDENIIPISDFKKYVARITDLTILNGSLPIGFPTSPQLSNGFLFEFDGALYDFCSQRSLTYTRYSDDIIISGSEVSQLLELQDRVQDLLHNHGSENLLLSPKKTRITHIGNKVKILGLIITPDGRVTVDAKYKNVLETLMYFYVNDKVRFENFLEKIFEGTNKERSLFGLFHYVKATDPDYIAKLQRKYGLLTLRNLMEDKWSGK